MTGAKEQKANTALYNVKSYSDYEDFYDNCDGIDDTERYQKK